MRLMPMLRRLFSPRSIRTLRDYGSYTDYLDHQKAKTLDPARREKWLGAEWQSKVDGFKRIFERNADVIRGNTRALCLGARTGQEVVALQELGVDALGIDLVPCPPLVEAGDIHDLRFEDDAFDLLFTNIVDHSLYPDRFVTEMERVCRPGGAIILHLQLGVVQDEFSFLEVESPKAVVALFRRSDVLASRHIDNGFDPMNWEVVLRRR